MPALDRENRKRLDKAVRAARKLLETGESGQFNGEAFKALRQLAVHEVQPYEGLSLEQKALRRRLRARGRQLGDVKHADNTQGLRHLAAECAYEHWHRMLFARFLAENNMLIEPEHNVPVDLDTCRGLAEERGEKLWDMVGGFAQRLLPRIFRPDDAVLEVPLEIEEQRELEALVADLPAEVFKGDDSLGWVYQFWQADEKDRVNATEAPIGANELPAVTQLFTEHYMVQFLLHNTLGAWYAAKVLAAKPELARDAASEQALREAVALPTYTWDYMRFVREGENGPWRPAGGTFSEWPRLARDLKVLDPCCGSGHFLVELFTILLALRRHEEGRPVEDLIREVLRNNLRGLELDPRCTQIAAFAVAMAAWKAAGRVMSDLDVHVACSGISVGDDREAWEKLAGRELTLRDAMGRLYDLFKQAPLLGSLIDPQRAVGEVFMSGFSQVRPVLENAVRQSPSNDEQRETGITAVHVAEAVRILTDRYNLVATNVPYLGRGKQALELKEYCDTYHAAAKADLATCFVERGLHWCAPGGSIAVVTPQNWLFLTSYKKLRERLLEQERWNMIARLGVGAFETISGHVVNVALAVISAGRPSPANLLTGLDANEAGTIDEKMQRLRESPLSRSSQQSQLANPDARVLHEPIGHLRSLGQYAIVSEGLHTGDYPRFGRKFWEVLNLGTAWSFQQGGGEDDSGQGGCEHMLFWQEGSGELIQFVKERLGSETVSMWIKGEDVWGRIGVAAGTMGTLKAATYLGTLFTHGIVAIVPNDDSLLPAIAVYASSPEFNANIRLLDQKVCVARGAFESVPFDDAHWRQAAALQFPQGLPDAQTNDPTQWLFHGHIAGIVAAGPAAKSPLGVADPVGEVRHSSLISREPNLAAVLHVGAARLLGYRWPAEFDTEMRLDVAQRAWVEHCTELVPYADTDGIVCLTSLRGESSAADRLRKLLVAALGVHWKSNTERQLIEAAGHPGLSLEDWLRDHFFEQHLALFHNMPFIWHIWDGRKDGFHALVNYHKLAQGGDAGKHALEKLTYTYLGEWLTRQQASKQNEEAGAEARLAAAQILQAQLAKIIEGEPPYDLFVRWKPLQKQAIGWEPDINDGVRLNIRPFMQAKEVGKKGAGLLRAKPNIKWKKDRGEEPSRPRADFPWFWGWDEKTENFAGGDDFDGYRWNDVHYSRAFKQAARQRHGGQA